MEQELLEIIKKSINEILIGLYDSVRIIDVKTRDQYVLNSSGRVVKQEIFCHEFWDRGEPCGNCIADKASVSNGIEEKVEIYEGRIFLVVGLLIADGNFMVEIVKDITNLISAKEEIIYHCEALQEQLEKLAQNAYMDSLTGIWNRRYIEERFPATVNKAGTLGKNIAVLMSDIDHFKRVNDTYGHTNGDIVLRTVAGILQRSIRGQDAAVRYGGEEFCAILFDIPKEVAIRVAERIREQVSHEEIIIKGEPVKVTISIGVSFGGSDITAEELISVADRRLYQAKDLGRNRVVWEDE